MSMLPSSLVYAATDGRHRPASHPVLRGLPRYTQPEPAPEPDLATLGAIIRTRREAMGWSRRRLGSCVGVSHIAVHYWESGSYRPTERHMVLLEQVMGSLR